MQIHARLLPTLLGFFLAANLLTCDDAPTEPKETPSALFYMTSYNGKIHTYNVGSRKADSMETGRLNDHILLAAPTGTDLFAANWNGFLYRMDSRTGEVLDSHAMMVNYDMAISPDGRMLAVMGSEGLRIYGTEDFDLVYETTAVIYQGEFTSTGSNFIGRLSNGAVCDLNLSGAVPASEKSFDAAVMKVVASEDALRWFMIVSVSFRVYSVDDDSLIYWQQINSTNGDLALAKGTDYVFFTESSDLNSLPAPSRVNVYNWRTNEFVDSISTLGLVEGDLGSRFQVRSLCGSQDGRWMLVVEGREDGRAFLIIDTHTLQVDTVLVYAQGTGLRSPTSQTH